MQILEVRKAARKALHTSFRVSC